MIHPFLREENSCHFIQGTDSILLISLSGLYIAFPEEKITRPYLRTLQDYLDENPSFKDLGIDVLRNRFPNFEYIFEFIYVAKKKTLEDTILLASFDTMRAAEKFIAQLQDKNVSQAITYSIDKIDRRTHYPYWRE